jgi:hypothetical protein
MNATYQVRTSIARSSWPIFSHNVFLLLQVHRRPEVLRGKGGCTMSAPTRHTPAGFDDNPRSRCPPTCTEFGNGPFLGVLGAALGVLLGVVLGSLPAGGEFFLAGDRQGRANSDHGPRKTGGQQNKDERRGDRRGKQTHNLANPRERGRSRAPPSSLL